MFKKPTRSVAAVLVAAAAMAASLAAQAATYSNSGAINIPAIGTGTPNPAQIVVSGFTGAITDLDVTLSGFNHTSPSDIGVLLVSPTGQSVVLMDGAGGFTPVSGLSLTFDDQASTQQPYFADLSSGSYVPTSFYGSVFSAPAPQSGYGSLLSAFNGSDANGTWSLYVEDFSDGNAGSFGGGFSLNFAAAVPEPSTYLLLAFGLAALAFTRRRATQQR